MVDMRDYLGLGLEYFPLQRKERKEIICFAGICFALGVLF